MKNLKKTIKAEGIKTLKKSIKAEGIQGIRRKMTRPESATFLSDGHLRLSLA
jgi:hypothetical protein